MGFTFFLHEKVFSLHLLGESLWVAKETMTMAIFFVNEGCLMRKKIFFWFGIVPFYTHLDQEEAACSGNSEQVSKLENVANANKERARSAATAQPRQGEGRARWSFPSQISMIYNRTWMTRKKWDAIWKLIYKIESQTKTFNKMGKLKKKLKWILGESTNQASLKQWWRSKGCNSFLEGKMPQNVASWRKGGVTGPQMRNKERWKQWRQG